jgi:hypothetical protein
MAELTEERCELVLTRVAQWMNREYGDGDEKTCVPTGPRAAYHGQGPELIMGWVADVNTWDSIAPALILEGLTDWADYASAALGDELRELLGVHTEVWGGYALMLYPTNREER